MQHHYGPDGISRSDEFVTYEVPLYDVRLVGGNYYPAIRFGLRNKGDRRIPDSRPCDTGLSEPRV